MKISRNMRKRAMRDYQKWSALPGQWNRVDKDARRYDVRAVEYATNMQGVERLELFQSIRESKNNQ